MLAKLFSFSLGRSERCNHPLVDGAELDRVLAALPPDNDRRALGELADWLKSLVEAADFPPAQLLPVVWRLDEAAQPVLRRLAREHAVMLLGGSEGERPLWTLCHGFLSALLALYGRCLQAAQESAGTARQLEAQLAPAQLRTVLAVSQLQRWAQRHYLALDALHWRELARAVSMAEHAGTVLKPLNAYPQLPGLASVQQELAKLLAYHAASPGNLQPAEMLVAEQVVSALAGHFAVAAKSESASLYVFGLLDPAAPQRLADDSGKTLPGQRFFRPGKARGQLEQWLKCLERGEQLPPQLGILPEIPPATCLAALRHLLRQYAPKPEQRRHPRHPVDHRVAVLRGFLGGLDFLRGSAVKPCAWRVENVGHGGMGMRLEKAVQPPPQVGEFLLARPAGGDNWLPGVVRRVVRRDAAAMGLGVMTLGTAVALQEFRIINKTGQVTDEHCSGLLLTPPVSEGEALVVLPLATFDVWQSLLADIDGHRQRLFPLAIAMRGGDYEVARYRIGAAG